MEFRTAYQPKESSVKINHRDGVIMIGSCFADSVGERMERSGFNVTLNPFGVLFNPLSIYAVIGNSLMKKEYTEKDFFLQNGRWVSYWFHGEISSVDLSEAVAMANHYTVQLLNDLKKAKWLTITFGTAWVYEHLSHSGPVANCHKVPSHQFSRRKLGVNEIVSEFSRLIEHLRNVNPELKILFTISPVRHVKDGLVENNWSKSTLNIAVHELIRRYEQTFYFPSFEILTDDLRDYRFYKKDMIHPNEVAVDYVWEIFSATYFSDETRALSTRVEKFFKGKDHRALHPDTEAHQEFMNKLGEERRQLMQMLPHLESKA